DGRAGLRRDDGQRAQVKSVETNGVRSAHANADRSILETYLTCGSAKQRTHGGIRDLLWREADSVRLRLVDVHVELGAGLAHTVIKILDPLNARQLGLDALRVGFQAIEVRSVELDL